MTDAAFTVLVLGCLDGIVHGAAGHVALAAVSCGAALAALWLPLDAGEAV